jgi:uncharacterized protein
MLVWPPGLLGGELIFAQTRNLGPRKRQPRKRRPRNRHLDMNDSGAPSSDPQEMGWFKRGAPTSTPLRTCIGCRGKDPCDLMIRFVRNPEKSGILMDLKRVLPGRGAYSHPSHSCLAQAHRRVQASLRLVHPVDLDGVGVVLLSSIDSSHR